MRALLLALSIASAASFAREELTPEAAIETARFMLSPEATGPGNPHGAVSISPDGKRYVIRTLRGDVERDGVWMQLYAGELTSLSRAAQPQPLARFFTTGLGAGEFEFLGPDLDASEYFNPVRWLGNDRIAFSWSDARRIPQAAAVSVPGGEISWLTSHDTPVGAFDVSREGLVIYNADAGRTPVDTPEGVDDGLVIPDDADAYSVFKGDFLGGTALDWRMNTNWFIKRPHTAAPEPIAIGGRRLDLHNVHRVRFSPDGALALLNSAPLSIPVEWDRYTQPLMRSWIAEARRNPRDMMARGVHQLFVVDVVSKTSRPLWDTPTVTAVTEGAWSADGRHVVLAPTYLPVERADSRGLEGKAAAIVEVATGRFEQLPVELPAMQPLAFVRWPAEDRIVLGEETSRGIETRAFRRSGGVWRLETQIQKLPRLRMELRQSLQQPPQLFVVDRERHTERLALDPNPGLMQRFVWGRVEDVGGTLDTGDAWEGLLFYPPDYSPRRRYPLVIQSVYESIAARFTLYGSGTLGPSELAPYPGRLLANRGVLVLHLNVRIGSKFNTPREAQARMAAFEEIADLFSRLGKVDRERVGLLGFSRNGYWVEYTLTHSRARFAAALASDNFDPSYLPITLMGDVINGTAMNGEPPFGEGLNAWIEHAPGFNVDKIDTPLLKIQQSLGLYGVLLNWELFSRLRYLGKPVELYLPPDYAHCAHNTQNPRQILAIQQRAMDWFDFWLNDHEDSAGQKATQYLRWRKMRRQVPN